MKSYVERNFGKDYVKKANIQEVGVYYNTPASNIKEEHLDVPMGHKVIIVGLTDSEYYSLEDGSFDDIDIFTKKQLQNIIEL